MTRLKPSRVRWPARIPCGRRYRAHQWPRSPPRQARSRTHRNSFAMRAGFTDLGDNRATSLDAPSKHKPERQICLVYFLREPWRSVADGTKLNASSTSRRTASARVGRSLWAFAQRSILSTTVHVTRARTSALPILGRPTFPSLAERDLEATSFTYHETVIDPAATLREGPSGGDSPGLIHRQSPIAPVWHSRLTLPFRSTLGSRAILFNLAFRPSPAPVSRRPASAPCLCRRHRWYICANRLKILSIQPRRERRSLDSFTNRA